jgi:hypothetical protein
MIISRTQVRKALQISPFLVALVVAGCDGMKPYVPRDDREEGPEQGIFSGPDGEFVINGSAG